MIYRIIILYILQNEPYLEAFMKSEIIFILCLIVLGILFGFVYKIQNENIETSEIKDSVINKIIDSNITDDMSEYDKVKVIHDYIIKETKYDIDNLNNNTIPSIDYTAKGVLEKHIGVCRGYAEAFKLLMDRLKIECVIVSGEASNISHAWNKVKLDGEWYNIDCTYDDPVTHEKEDTCGDDSNLQYDYFLITDSQINIDHNAKKKKNKKCISEKYMYTEKRKDIPFITVSDPQQIVSEFLKKTEYNKTEVTFYLSENINLEDTGIISKIATSLAFSGGKYQNIYYTPLRQCGNYYYTTISVD